MKDMYILCNEGRVEISTRGYLVIGKDLHDALEELRELSESAYNAALDYIRGMVEQDKREAVFAK